MRDRALGSTIRMQFVSTNPDAGGAPVAPSSAFAPADIRIYKDGSASEKTTSNGISVTSPFDSLTGLHLVEIDTSNSTGDAGFWSSGSVYHVRLVTAKTVATYSVSGLLIGEFSLELQTADVRKFGGTAGTFASGIPEVKVASMAADSLTAAAIAADAGAELAALVETYIVNEGDATAVLQAVADKIAADWVAGDASPLAIASAVWSAGTRTITGGALTTAPPTASAIADAVWDEARTGHTTAGTFGFYLDAAISGISGGSGGAGDAEQATSLEILEAVDSIAVALAGGSPVEPTGRIAAGGKVTAYIGDDFKVRSGTELPIPVTDPAEALKAKLEAIGIENLFFGAAPKDGPAGAIAGTVASITATGGITTISIEITNCGADLMPGSMPYQIQQSQPQGTEYDDFVEIEGALILKPRTVRPRG